MSKKIKVASPRYAKQTKKELSEENRSLRKQLRSLRKRREFLSREVMALDHRIKRKRKFHDDNNASLDSSFHGDEWCCPY